MKTVNVLDYGKAENITEAVKNALDDIKKEGNGETTLVFPKGEYHFFKDNSESRIFHTSNTDSKRFPEKHIAFLMENMENVIIDGDGSEFIFHGNMTALAAVRCKNIMFKNFSWDYPCATTSEMKVVNVGKNYVDYRIPTAQEWEIQGKSVVFFETSPITGKRYWTRKDDSNTWCVSQLNNERKTLLRCPFPTNPFSPKRIGAEKIDDNTVRLKYFGKPPKNIKENTISVICPNKDRDTAGAFFWECENITVKNIQPLYLHGFSWLVQMCRNITFSKCRFVPKENGERFITSFADSIHVAGCAGFVHIEDCEFSHDLDDPINIHGTFMRVEKMIDSHTLKLIYCHGQQGGFKQFWVGDKVVFYSRDYLDDVDDGREFTVKSVVDPSENGNSLMETIVEFNEELPVFLEDKIGSEGKYVAENVTYTADVIIRNCKFSVVPTRGILCTTRGKVLIENNEFYGMAMASIFISNDCNDWYESGPVRDVTIRGNTFYVLRSGQRETQCKGGVYIQPITKGGKLPYYTNPIHRNITIEDNTFYMEHERVVCAKSVKNLTIRNNTVKKYSSPETDATIKAFSFDSCCNVVLQNNKGESGIDFKPVFENMPESEIHAQE